MGVLDHTKIWNVTTPNFSVGTVGTDVYMKFSNGDKLVDSYYLYIDQFCNRLVNINFNSILIGGLGLGVIPQYIANNSSCETIDVLEIDPTMISVMSNFGIYDNRINIIEGDVYSYTPVQGYDVILFDLWWRAYLDETFINTIELLRNKYNPYLNPNGYLYFPVWVSNDYYPKI